MSNLDIETKKELVLSPEKIISAKTLGIYIQPLLHNFNKFFLELSSNSIMVFKILTHPVYQIQIDNNSIVLTYLTGKIETDKKQIFNNTSHGKTELLICLSLSYLKKKKIIKRKLNHSISGEWEIEYLKN